MYLYHNFFIHSFVDRHLHCFHVLAIINSAAINSGIHVSFPILVSLGYMLRSEIDGSFGGFIPRFLRKFHTIFHSGCINLFSHQQCKRFPFSPQPHQHLLFVDSLMMVFLTGGEGNGNAFQYSYLENPMDRGAWRPIIHRVTKSCL